MAKLEEPTIILVEDDTRLCLLIEKYLKKHNYQIIVESYGNEVVERIVRIYPDLVILDNMQSDFDGISICRKIRKNFVNPILMLNSMSKESDVLAGLDAGADDFLLKPVKPPLLLARVKALLKRQKTLSEKTNQINLGSITVDAKCRDAEFNGNPLHLTSAEFDLLWLLANHAGQALSRDTISSELRGFDYDGLNRTIDLRVARLRKKLGDSARDPQIIKSVRSVGYMLVRS